MGRLHNGKWVIEDVNPKTKDGEYQRQIQHFRDKIEKASKFSPESGRYHLYVSLACPWAHRTLIYRQLKGLESHIDYSVVNPWMLENGWSFDTDFKGTTGDKLYDKKYIYEIYQMADDGFSGRVTVPILWDKKEKTIVNNESSEIIHIFNYAFNELTGNELDFSPAGHSKKIEEWNNIIYHGLNNGVYQAGFARTQEAYNKHFQKVFETLDLLEDQLKKSKTNFFIADQLTETDIRLFTTLIRFDAVYYSHFKCNKKRISDYPHLGSYCKAIYQIDGVKQTVDFDHIKTHYFGSHETINPTRIIPQGPDLSFYF